MTLWDYEEFGARGDCVARGRLSHAFSIVHPCGSYFLIWHREYEVSRQELAPRIWTELQFLFKDQTEEQRIWFKTPEIIQMAESPPAKILLYEREGDLELNISPSFLLNGIARGAKQGLLQFFKGVRGYHFCYPARWTNPFAKEHLLDCLNNTLPLQLVDGQELNKEAEINAHLDA